VKYKTLFRLVLRIIGVYFFFQGVANGPDSIAYALYFEGWSSGGTFGWIATLMWIVSPFVQISIGLYLFFGGKWIVNKAIPSNRRYCHECGYMLEGIKGDRCPECDTEFRSAGEPSGNRPGGA
jgi:uncharacterized paraquat-inducible protein A